MKTELNKSPMELALDEARLAMKNGEVPVGAILLSPDRKFIYRTHNRMREFKDPTAHAEILAIRQACTALGTDRLPDHDLFVTLEPCAMCAAAISFARIRRLYYGASDPKAGGIEHGPRFFSQPTCHHKPEIYPGFEEQSATHLLKEFFQGLREPND